MITANVGDKLTTNMDGYRSGTIRRYTVKRVTATKIVATLDSGINQVEYRFDRRDGTCLPRDKYINEYITHVNLVPIE